MDILDKLSYDLVQFFDLYVQGILKISGIICIDGNLLPAQFASLLKDCRSLDKTILCEPTSVPKAVIMIRTILSCVDKPRIYITPDESELMVMAKEISIEKWKAPSLKEINPEILNAAAKLLTVVDKAIIKLGSKGVLLGQNIDNTPIWSHLKPFKVHEQVVSVTGAGDSLVGSLISGLSSSPSPLTHDQFEELVKACIKAAELSILCDRAVSDQLDSSIFAEIPWLNKKYNAKT
jgi:pseudouridine-5'-phosphate glycosidase/pseudouridine kinase